MYELAIYGGTFAPVHNGHIHAANSFLDALCPDKLLIMPNRITPRKQDESCSSPEDRLNMLKLAFEDHPLYENKIFISDHELLTPAPSYTVNTLKHFAAPDTRLTFLVGTDMFLILDKWYLSSEIFRLSRIALMKRETETPEITEDIEKQTAFLRERFKADIITVDISPIEISSSQIRSGDDDLRQKYLPKKVYLYIKEHSLYENK